MIPESFVQELLSRVDIVDVVGKYVQLRKGGANFVGLCPFHQEKTGSFSVSPSKQLYHCFGCGASGNSIGFLMEYTGISFPEAVERLALDIGVTVPKERMSPAQEALYKQKIERQQTLSDILNIAQNHYFSSLEQYPPALKYLQDRGLAPSTIEKWGLGWAGDFQSLSHVFPKYQDNPLLIESGMAIMSDKGRFYDRFHHRVTFPIYNEKGHIIAFGGRILGNEKPKYLNSPETVLFDKSHSLYGLWENRKSIHKQNSVLVVEGYMDVVSLSQFGVDYAVATLGTAITEHHLRKLMRSARRIIFSFDGDQAGQRAALKAFHQCLPMLRDDVVIRFLFLPEEHDPDSYIRAFGLRQFEICLENSLALSDFFLDYFKKKYDLSESEGRSACIKESLELFAQIPDIILKGQIESQFVQMLGLSLEEFRRYLEKHEQKTEISDSDLKTTESKKKKAVVKRTVRSDTANVWVLPLRQRLMTLLVTHPELAHKTNPFYLRLIYDEEALEDLKRLLVHMMNYPVLNTASLLRSLEQDKDLYRLVYDIACHSLPVGEEFEGQWKSGMKKIHIDALKKEQKALTKNGMDEVTKARYREILQKIRELETSFDNKEVKE